MGLGVKKKLEIAIGGQNLSVASDDDDEYVMELASFVNKKMGEMAERGKATGTLSVAILAALNIADELYKLRKERVEWSQRVDEISKRMLATLGEKGDLLSSR